MLVPRRFLIHVTSLQDFNPPHWLMTNFQSYDDAVLCPGNPDEKFVSACKDKGGCVRGVRGNGDVVAFIDKSSVTDHSGKQSQCIVRVDWDMLCGRSSHYSLRCKSCQSLRSTLRSLVSHQSNESASNTSASSHTRYQDLTTAEKYERLKIFIVATLKVSNQKVKWLQAKVDKLIAKQSACLQDNDAADISHIITEMSPIVEDRCPLNSPQCIFWD